MKTVAHAVPAVMLPLLNRLVDRFDRAQQSGRPVRQALRVDARSFPELFEADLESDKELLWRELLQLEQQGFFTLKLERAQPHQAAYERCPKLAGQDEALIRAAIGRVARIKSAPELWREAVARSNLTAEAKAVVAGYHVEVAGRSASEVVGALVRLHEFVDSPLLLREVSARIFWGQSKMLDGRQGLVQAVLAVTECPFPEMPVQLHVHLPHGQMDGVLFIENLATFEQAASATDGPYQGLALVYAAGFKAGARRLRAVGGCALYWSARGSVAPERLRTFQDWLLGRRSLPSWFWGDLDFSGMRILVALKRSFDELQAWQPGYLPMLAALSLRAGHAPQAAGKELQLELEATGCAFSDEALLPAMRRTGQFLDQEGFTPVGQSAPFQPIHPDAESSINR